MTRPASSRTTVRRRAARGRYEPEAIRATLAQAFLCHVGIVEDGQPFVLPMAYAVDGDHLVLHGAPHSRLLAALSAGAPACVTVTILDGLVLARSAFHHSINYRSVVVLGRGEAVEDPAEKDRLLRLLTEHVVPGRLRAARPPSAAELAATRVVRIPLHEASAKVRAGPPIDDPEDQSLPIWAGVVPLRLVAGAPEPAPDLAPGTPAPERLQFAGGG